MKKLISLVTFMLLLNISVQASECTAIYFNYEGDSAESNAVGSLFESYSDSHHLIISHESVVEDIEYLIPNSLILNLNSETDMTGKEVQVQVYKIDNAGKLNFMGSRMKAARFFKADALEDLARSAIAFSCGRNDLI
ncbi:hypothetical protein A9Q84_16615 [Halobacteriovorax marinus]|uniref:Lipoprotein n=1 Tax=Halobacteriovorax marinus TaxID=97084 RepID=A0A1Y5F4X7_9BACT|nr:hypothetical protein A9Q84_16615 [Halobacteriovorax marinus]